MPPKAPSGASHMISRITPKTIRDITSKTLTIALRWRSASIEIDAATRIARTRTRRISFSTNGETKLVGSRSSVMKPTSPGAVSPASAIDSLAASLRRRARLAVEAGARARRCWPRAGRARARSPSSRRSRPSARSASPPARARLPSEAMPITTVRKITGPVTALISWMNASASHFAFSAWPGATRPKTMPARDRDDDPEPQLLEDSSLSHGQLVPAAELSARAADLHGG